MFLVSGSRSLSLRIIAYNIVVCVLWVFPPVAANGCRFSRCPTRREPFNLSAIYILRRLMLQLFQPDETRFGHFCVPYREGRGSVGS